MRKLSFYLCSLLMAFAVSCSQPEPEVAPESSNTSLDKNARKQTDRSAPIRATIAGKTYNGTYQIREFIEKNGLLYAVGNVKGIKQIPSTMNIELQVVSANGVDLTSAQAALEATFQFASAQQAGTCDILNLVLGPLNLNILGLEVFLDTVVLDIIANPAGGLLGQLLCAVANLLDGGLLGGLQDLLQLVDLLNQILDILN